jgi:hypothetical protein
MRSFDNKPAIGIALLIFAIVMTLVIYEKFALNNCYYTYAIYKGTEGSGVAINNVITFNTIDGIKTKAKIYYSGKYEVGDTVWIKYSIRDHSVAEVIDTDYKKYLKNLPKEK